MKAIIIRHYGGPEVLQLTDLPLPQIKLHELLVKVKAAGVNPVDWKIRKGYLPFLLWLKKPYIAGSDLAGEVIKIGKNVARFKINDQIFAQLGIMAGAYCEYAVVPEQFAALKPKNLDFNQTAAIPIPAATAYFTLKTIGKIKKADRVLINGASGGVGTFAVQLAKTYDAHVTGICSSRNVNFVEKLGAEKVIDYTKDETYNDQAKYNLIFDTIGNLSFIRCLKLLKPQSFFVSTGFNLFYFIVSIFTNLFLQKKYVPVFVMSNSKNLAIIAKLIEENKLKVVIDRVYPLEKAKEAQELSETAHARGRIVLSI